ncbi:MAG: low specificity L-threonine aldolase [Lachnospiraceae bacterium]|nr:low specificity L-threonine aldolase [Lachnospiraceae bacterium]
MKSTNAKRPGPILSTDYTAGAHPAVLRALIASNAENTPGYGSDHYCAEAAAKIRRACRAPKAEVFFLTGGTQTNALALDALLKPYEGVLAAETGHIAVHEAGAVEFTGHKVLTLPAKDGRIRADSIVAWCERFYADESYEHMVFPGVIYLSQPTEYGTLYSLEELTRIRAAADRFGLKIYADGARLAYALACPENDVQLPDLARLCDAFYIGGTKCGALFGEALVLPRPGLVPHFITIEKQHGAMLAKGRLLGVQFKRLFERDLYRQIGCYAVETAQKLRESLQAAGFEPAVSSPTNQIFFRVKPEIYRRLQEANIGGFWDYAPDGTVVVRFVCSWATRPEEPEQLCSLLKGDQT